MDTEVTGANSMVPDDPQWYVQKGSRVQGPYSADEVARFLLLGRVRNCDRVSRDGELWEPVTQVPELIPDELLDLNSDAGWERFVSARNTVDERDAANQTNPSQLAGRRQLDPSHRNWLRLGGARRNLDAGLDIDLADTTTPYAAYDLLPPSNLLREADRVRDDWNRSVQSPSSALPWSLLGVTLVVLGVGVYLNSVGVSPS